MMSKSSIVYQRFLTLPTIALDHRYTHAGLTLHTRCTNVTTVPGAVRIGTPALTTRGFDAKDFDRVAEYLTTTVELAKKIQAESGKPLKVSPLLLVVHLDP